jgi:hypothetical protein
LYAACAIYSIVRYVLFAPENAQNLPVFVLNKGISMGAALCFSLAFWQQWKARGSGDSSNAATWFRAGIFGAVAHIPMSLTILRPSYFKEFFAGERLSFHGEMVFLCGALAAAGIYLLTRTSWTAWQRWQLSLATLGVLWSHTLFMGLARGLNITRSHAYLPPMWLLSLIGITLGLVFLLMTRPQKTAPPDVST